VNAVTKAVSAVLTVALMVAAMWLYGRKPHLKAGNLKPLLAQGHIGAVVTTGDFSVKVGSVVVAASIQKPDFPKPQVMKTPDLFVIVQAQARSEHRPFQLGHVRLLTRGGVAYQESGRAALPSSDGMLEPMLWTPATYIFEIPKDRLAGARLVVGEADLLNQLSGETDVDLRIDGGKAARLSAHPTPTYALKSTL
jgi:hypothetical protein